MREFNNNNTLNFEIILFTAIKLTVRFRQRERFKNV